MKPCPALALTFAALLLGGCASSGSAGHPAVWMPNVYRTSNALPAGLRRVAVLPVTCESGVDAEAGRDALQPVLLAELSKTGAFQVVPVSPEDMRALTGRSFWSANEVLPSDFFERLRKATACDAVLFCQLKHFRAYPPVAVGWDLKLVEADHRSILWALDEVFDAGQPSIACAAQHYYAQATRPPSSLGDAQLVLLSPRLFGQYAAASSLAAMPAR